MSPRAGVVGERTAALVDSTDEVLLDIARAQREAVVEAASAWLLDDFERRLAGRTEGERVNGWGPGISVFVRPMVELIDQPGEPHDDECSCWERRDAAIWRADDLDAVDRADYLVSQPPPSIDIAEMVRRQLQGTLIDVFVAQQVLDPRSILRVTIS